MAETNKAADSHSYQYSLGWYKAGRAFWGAIFHTYMPIMVRGAQYIPKHGPAIVCANHISMIDPFLVGYTLNTPHPVAYMAKAELFKSRPLAYVMSRWGAFPVDRSKQDASALRTALAILKAGEVLGMFPEGTRGSGGQMQEVRTGALRLAIRTQSPLIPAGVAGTERVLPRGGRFPKPGRLVITYGPPMDLSNLYDRRPTEAEIEAAAEELRVQLDHLHTDSVAALKK